MLSRQIGNVKIEADWIKKGAITNAKTVHKDLPNILDELLCRLVRSEGLEISRQISCKAQEVGQRRLCSKSSSSSFSGFSTSSQISFLVSKCTAGGSGNVHEVSSGSSNNINNVVTTFVTITSDVATFSFTKLMVIIH